MAKKKRKLPFQNEQPADLSDTTLTPKLIDEIAKLYRLGLRDSAVANMVGKSPYTIREWMLRGAMGSTNPLFNELFTKCAKAVSSLETELLAEIRVHAFGRGAEYAKETVKMPDGSIIERTQFDGNGKPVVIREEIKGNPSWIAWIMERRFRNEWSNYRDNVPVESTPDMLHSNTMQQKEEAQNFGVSMSKQERIEMLELMKSKVEAGKAVDE